MPFLMPAGRPTNLFLLLYIFSFQYKQTYSFASIACYLPGYECCAEPYIKSNIQFLKKSLELNLFGQDLASATLLVHLKSHLKSSKSHQPLIFFFHGGPGTGKSHTAKILLNGIFKRGPHSNFAHSFYFGTTFPNTIKETELVESIHFRIWSTTKSCERSVFVFDGFDPLWSKVLKALRLNNERLYKKSVFIFITSIGKTSMENYILQEYRNGRKRQSLNVKELQNVAQADLISKTGTLFEILPWDAMIYIPFLPLTKTQVMQCIERELMKKYQMLSATALTMRKLKGEILDQILEDSDKDFVASGCKRVSEKTLYTIGLHKNEL